MEDAAVPIEDLFQPIEDIITECTVLHRSFVRAKLRVDFEEYRLIVQYLITRATMLSSLLTLHSESISVWPLSQESSTSALLGLLGALRDFTRWMRELSRDRAVRRWLSSFSLRSRLERRLLPLPARLDAVFEAVERASPLAMACSERGEGEGGGGGEGEDSPRPGTSDGSDGSAAALSLASSEGRLATMPLDLDLDQDFDLYLDPALGAGDALGLGSAVYVGELSASAFGGAFYLPWPRFVEHFALGRGAARLLRFVLSAGESVTLPQFDRLVRLYGELPGALARARRACLPGHFHGHLTRAEAELALHGSPPGTFLTRFSESRSGAFALCYRATDGTLRHVLAEPNVENEGGEAYCRLRVVERGRVLGFAELAAVVDFYRESFLHQELEDPHLLQNEWFHGDVDSAEAKVLLADAEEGAFLLRYSASKPGKVSASFVREGAVSHVRMDVAADGHVRLDRTGDCYGSTQDFVEKRRKHLRTPLEAARYDLYRVKAEVEPLGEDDALAPIEPVVLKTIDPKAIIQESNYFAIDFPSAEKN